MGLEYQSLWYGQYDSKSKEEFLRINELISQHLLEPYSIYVYWFFLNTWPQYCYIVKEAKDSTDIIGVIISKVEPHREMRMRGYIGMLVIDPAYRGRRIATSLVKMTIKEMINNDGIDEVMLETEVINEAALRLYQSLGFAKTKRLYRYYMNTHDAYRLILPVTAKSGVRTAFISQNL